MQKDNLPRFRPPNFYVLSGLLVALFVVGLLHAQRHFIDYVVYETAGNKLLSGQASNLYDKLGQKPDGFYYAYIFAFLFAPFAALGGAGKFLFFLVYFACYLKILTFSCRTARKLLAVRPGYGIEIATVILTLYAVNDGLMNANIGPLLLVLCLYAFEKRERMPLLSGVLLGTAIAIKSYPVVVLGFFLWEKRARVTLSAVLTCLFLLFVLPVLVHGWDTGVALVTDYWEMLAQFKALWNSRGWNFDAHVFQNLTATAARYGKRFGWGVDASVFVSSLIGLLGLVLFFIPSFLRKTSENFRTGMFFLTLAAVPMLVPISWYNMALFYTPLMAYLVVRAVEKKDRVALVSLTLYVLLFCLTTPDLVGRPANRWLCERSIPWFGLVAIVLGGVVCLLKDYEVRGEIRSYG